MKKILLSINFLLPIVCYSSYVESTYSAEVIRLANNVAKDYTVESVWLNPASLKNVYVPEVLLTYNIIYPNLTDKTEFLNNSVVFVQKTSLGGIGLGFNQFGVKEWYTRDKFVFSFGSVLIKSVPQLSLGIKLGYLRESYSLDDYMKTNPVFSRSKEKSVLFVTIGAVYETTKFGSFGITVENINRPDIGFYTGEYLPIELNFGNMYSHNNLNLYPGVKVELKEKMDYSFSLSAEYEFRMLKNKLKLSPSLGIIYGSRQLNKFLFGFSIQTLQVGFVYGIGVSLIDKFETGHHQCISLSYKFSPQPLTTKIPKEQYDKIVEEKIKLEQELETLKKHVEKKYEKPVTEEKPVIIPITEEKVSTPTIEELLLKKLEELERKLKEAETKPKPTVTPQPVTPPLTTTPPTPPKKKYHTVVAGDTLPKLAEKYYGDASQWRKIYEANKDKIIRGQLIPGSVLEIP